MDKVLTRLRSLSAVQQRRAACLLGAVVADTAIAPLHWIYDQEKVAGLVASGVAEFSPQSHCPFYTVPAGEPSAYGVQLLFTLKGLVEDNGFYAAKQADRLFKHFGPGTPFEETRKQKASPVLGTWTNHNIKIFLAKREEGDQVQSDSGSKDPDGLVKAISIVAMYHGKPELLAKVEECVTVTQSNPVAVGYALAGAQLLSHVVATGNHSFDAVIALLNSTSSPIDKEIAKNIEKARSAASTSHPEAVKSFALSCPMPPSFLGMVHGAASSGTYVKAVRDEILAAGDNCARISFVGGYMAAKGGLDSIPVEWMEKVNGIEQILTQIETIVKN